MNIAGAVITLRYDGELEITRGLIKAEHAKHEKTAKPKDPNALPKSLERKLKAQHCAALSAEIAARPDVAFAALVHALALQALRHQESHGNCLRIITNPGMPEDESSKAFAALEQQRAAWDVRLPDSSEALWEWCLAQEQQTLMDLLAFCTALSISTAM